MSRPIQGSYIPLRVILMATVVLALAGCEPRSEPGSEMIAGECSQVYGANVCTWGENVGGEIVAFGATVPMDFIENAPLDLPMVWPPLVGAVLSLPDAVSAATGFHVLTVYWEPHGHPPGPYLTPHFDFHFFSVTEDAMEAIDCSDLSKPNPGPVGYVFPDVNIPEVGDLVGLCVPTMGMHSLLATELASENLFEKTMVLGYYASQSIFVEPMVTKATLMAEESFTIDWPEAPGRPEGARYPTSFRAEYDSTARAYQFVFSGLPAETP